MVTSGPGPRKAAMSAVSAVSPLSGCAFSISGTASSLGPHSRSGGAEGTSDKKPAHILRVLIVDDNVGLAENIAEILDGEGYVTEIAASAEEALTRARAQEFNVLLTDFRLPGISGIELIRSLRREGQHPRAVVISAYGDDLTMNAALDVGAKFLGKPVDVPALNGYLRGVQGLA
jgi:CheY-like chemotaxis protein